MLQHPNIIKLIDVLYNQEEGKIKFNFEKKWHWFFSLWIAIYMNITNLKRVF
jgi:hypothetical protein